VKQGGVVLEDVRVGGGDDVVGLELGLVHTLQEHDSQKQNKRAWTRCALCDTTPTGSGEPGGSGRGECVRGAINNRAPHRSPRTRHRRARHEGQRWVGAVKQGGVVLEDIGVGGGDDVVDLELGLAHTLQENDLPG